MSRLGGPDFNYNEIARYIEKLKQERRVTEQNINILERERAAVDAQIGELERRRNDTNNRLHQEQELLAKQGRSLSQAEEAYQKIIDSSKTLANFVKNELQETRRDQ